MYSMYQKIKYSITSQFSRRVSHMVFFLSIFFIMFSISLVHASPIQVAPTVLLQDTAQIQEGAVIVANDERYTLSQFADAPEVFGVIAEKPALVFSTGADQVPVITEGVALVQVNGQGGSIIRGDVLVTSSVAGVAKKASTTDEYMFAIALEDYQFDKNQENTVGVIQADIGAERAQAVAQNIKNNTQESEEQNKDTSFFIRAIIASVLSIGALFFLLYSFRSTITQGVVSIGRNPRARTSIMTLTFGNIVFSLVLFAVVIFVAIAVLVLPV